MPILNVRISEAQKAELEARSGGDVSAYVRSVLFAQDTALETILHRLDDLTDDLSSLSESAPGGEGNNAALMPMVAELLLLMRMTVKADTKRQAQAEIERIGLPVWDTNDYRQED